MEYSSLAADREHCKCGCRIQFHREGAERKRARGYEPGKVQRNAQRGGTGTGGADIGPFTAAVTIPASPTLVSPLTNNFTVTRSSGMTVNWTGNGSNGIVQIQIGSAPDNSFTNGSNAVCEAPASAGTLTIPQYVLLALPAGNFGALNFQQRTAEVPFTATGLDVGFLQTSGPGTGRPSGFMLK